MQWSNLVDSIPSGIILGLLVGKQVGIFGVAFLLLKLKFVHLPEGLTLSMLWGLSMLCGIGFTMSLFIGSLAFEGQGETLQASYRLGILLGSSIAAMSAFVFLRLTMQQNNR